MRKYCLLIAMPMILAGCGSPVERVPTPIMPVTVGADFITEKGQIEAAMHDGRVSDYYLYRYDRLMIQDTLDTQSTGKPRTWVNPNNNARIEMRPTWTYEEYPARPCRDYQITVYLKKERKVALGTACKSHHGQWVQVKDSALSY